MAECVWGHVLAVERVAGAGRCGGVFGDELFDGVWAEGLSLSGREQGVVRLSVAFCEPLAQDRDGLGSECDGALFASLPAGEHVRSDGEVDVADAQADELGHSEPGLDRDQEECVVAAAVPAVAVGRGEQRLDLVPVEVVDVVALVALAGIAMTVRSSGGARGA